MQFRFVACLAVTVWSAFPALADPVPNLKPGEHWLAVASTKDLDTAKGIADYYRWRGARVMAGQDGWMAVVLGPFTGTLSEITAKDDSLKEDLPKDARLTNGANYSEQLWQVASSEEAERPMAEYAVDRPARLSAGSLSVEVSLTGDEDNPGPTTIKGMEAGQQAFTFTTNSDFIMLGAEAGMLRLDPTSSAPQVVVTRFTGGAHCCTMTWFVTKPKGSASWTMLDGSMLDGSGYGYEDLDGDGATELIHIDNSFLYAFDSYAGSFAMERYERLRGGKIIDVTETPEMQPLLRQQLARLEFTAKLQPDMWNSNGFLAAWVAAKNVLGEGDAAWDKMKTAHDKTSDFGPQECTSGQKVEDCPAENLKSIPFPKALAQFLKEHEYGALPKEAQAELQ